MFSLLSSGSFCCYSIRVEHASFNSLAASTGGTYRKVVDSCLWRSWRLMAMMSIPLFCIMYAVVCRKLWAVTFFSIPASRQNALMIRFNASLVKGRLFSKKTSGWPDFSHSCNRRMIQITFQLFNEGIGHVNDFGYGFLSFIHYNNPALKINLFKC